MIVSEDEIKVLVKNAVAEEVGKITKEYIDTKVREALFKKIDSYCDSYHIERVVERHVREVVEEYVSKYDDDKMAQIAKDIGTSLSWRIEKDIKDAVSYAFSRSDEGEEEDDDYY
jgi:hypothetical protein